MGRDDCCCSSERVMGMRSDGSTCRGTAPMQMSSVFAADRLARLAHAWQSSSDTDPVALDAVPKGHMAHEDAPVELPHVPGLQATHVPPLLAPLVVE